MPVKSLDAGADPYSLIVDEGNCPAELPEFDIVAADQQLAVKVGEQAKRGLHLARRR